MYIGTECLKLIREFPSLTLDALERSTEIRHARFLTSLGSSSLVPLKYVWIYENRVKD